MTIGEVASYFSLSQDTLRFYEKKGLIGPIKKNSSGIRSYTKEDMNRIEFIKCMRNAEIPIDVLKKYLDLFDQGKNTEKARQELLEEQRDKLKSKIETLEEAYAKLNYKIELYKTGKLDEYINN